MASLRTTRREANALRRRVNARSSGSAEILMSLKGQEKYRALSRRLRAAGRGDLQRKLTQAIRAEGQPALAAVRAAWLTVDVESSRGGIARPDTSTGLRKRTAAATRIQVRQNGITISTVGKRVDPNYPSLPMYLNSFPRRRPWRHPVFGHRLTWVSQRGEEVFYPTLIEFAPAWRKGIESAVESTIREIDGGA